MPSNFFNAKYNINYRFTMVLMKDFNEICTKYKEREKTSETALA